MCIDIVTARSERRCQKPK